ncbi:MAG TPA: hypothetical protein VHF22_07140, partial [Planctomycetota bacterium]|nr:hypothetical protein [Planctomycetota bacterium]
MPPFFEKGVTEGNTEDTIVRPIFRFREAPNEDRTDVHYLFPLGHYMSRQDDVEHHLYPFFQWDNYLTDDGFRWKDLLIFPFVFWGDHPGHGGYFTLWPFGGTLRNILLKDYILHIAFPLFAYTRAQQFEEYHVLWPIFSVSTGHGNSGFRFLPFYGHNEKHLPDGTLVADRYTVLWPFFEWEEDNKNSRNPFKAWVVFPFYGETRSRHVDETSVLWPLFRKRVEKDDGVTRWRVPFPFVLLSDGPNEVQRDFWPLYGYRRVGGFVRHFALWPIVRIEDHDRGDIITTRRYVLPFFWRYVDYEKATDSTKYEQTKIWPLFRLDRTREGGFGMRVPSVLWFKDDEQGTFENILTPLWELFRYKEDPVKGKELRLLFSIYKRRWGAPKETDNGWT